MINLALAVALQMSTAVVGADSYTKAHKVHMETGRPLVVLIGADWCPACRKMKDSIIPEARKHGILDDVAFATLNTDTHGDLARKMMSGGSIPQLVMYQKTKDGWKRTQLTGAQSLDSIRSFVDAAQPSSDVQYSSRQ